MTDHENNIFYYFFGMNNESEFTKDKLNKSYRNLSKQFHPDNGNDMDDESFSILSIIYKVLNNDDKRSEYNEGTLKLADIGRDVYLIQIFDMIASTYIANSNTFDFPSVDLFLNHIYETAIKQKKKLEHQKLNVIEEMTNMEKVINGIENRGNIIIRNVLSHSLNLKYNKLEQAKNEISINIDYLKEFIKILLTMMK